jgi:hypothetical protein
VTAQRKGVSRLPEAVLACCLSAVGLSTVALRLLANPTSRLSRWVDRSLLPEGITR